MITRIEIATKPELGDPRGEGLARAARRFLGIPVSRVGVKAKTNEGFGPVGKKKAIECLAVVSLEG